MQSRNFIIILLTVVYFSCQPKKSNQLADQVTDTTFIPHPHNVPKQEVKTLEIGSHAPNFKLPDISGKFYSLNDFAKAKALVIIFTCNHCPTAQAYEDRIIQFTNDYKPKGVEIVAIMPNSTNGLLPEECGYTDLNDSYEEMKIRAADKKYNFPYLYDGDNQSVAIAYGPVATPHAFIFNHKQELVYVGRIDSVEKPGTTHADDLRIAVDAVLSEKSIQTPVNKAFGCSIKWEWKGEYAKKIEKEWIDKPVTIEKISINGIKELVHNPTNKLRLINIWATWCAPCVAEYQDLVNLQRWYGQRDFEFISISADSPESEEKALAFLQQKHSAVKNYIYNGTNKYALIEAIDSQWNGALPYTLLVEPNGKVAYRYQGVVELHGLKKLIVEHPKMGRFY